MKVRKIDIPMPFTREELVNSREYKIAGAALNDVSNIDEEYANNEDYIGGYVDGFENGAEWADEHSNEGLVNIDKVCEYLTNHIDKGLVIYNDNTWLKRDEFIKKFKKEINK